ncbi:MAG TPA: hypothetical protein VGT60_08560 [Candidatus Limnocylindria bacterium]|nr:hypothetical protein [Candidatus Limnocylindria bacterium]
MPLTRVLLLVAALGLVAGGCGGSPPGAVVLVSGRDDHGLVYRAAVGLQRSSDDATVVGSVPDGTFARVVDRRAEWLRIRSVGTDPQEGWINTFYLRDVAVGLQPPRQVTFLDAAERDGTVMVLVRPRDEPDATGTWVAAASLREVGAAP